MKEDFNIWMIGLLAGLITFFSPIATILYVIIFASGLDLFTAIIRDFKKNNNIKGFFCKLRLIKSYKLRRTVIKIVLYTLFTMLIYAIEYVSFGQSVYITNLIAFLLLFAEAASIAENIDICLGSSLFTTIVKKVRKIMEDKIINKISEETNKTKDEI